jgi:tetratricopeptide (TPR) repeat protein
MVKFFLLIIILFCFGFGIHSQIKDKYENGINAYSNGNYQLAVQEFEEILKQNWESPELYYNLGNAYYRQKLVSGSIWAYEKCLALFPSHKDALYNLSLANLNVIDKIDLPPLPIYLKWYETTRNYFSLKAWITLFVMSFFIIMCLMAIRKIFFQKWLKTIENIIIIELIIIMLICTHSYLELQSNSKGIIFSPIVIAYSEPNEYSSKIVEVHEGLKVTILDLNDDWVNLELLDGTKGWILKNQIREL